MWFIVDMTSIGRDLHRSTGGTVEWVFTSCQCSRQSNVQG